MKSELYLNYKKNKNKFITVYSVFMIFSILSFTILININTFKYDFKIQLIFFISLYLTILIYIILWFILHKIAIKYESKNESFTKILVFLAWCLFMPYIMFYGEEKKQKRKQIIFSAIFNQFWLAIFLTLLFVPYFLILPKEKNMIFLYSNIATLTFIWTMTLIRIIFFIYLFFYKKGESKFLKVFSWILMCSKIYYKIKSLNLNQTYVPIKIKKNKIRKSSLLFENNSELFNYYKKRKIWFIVLILFFIYIFIFALGSAITMSQIKYNILFSVLSFVSLLGAIYFISWFILYKIAIKYENNNKPFPNWLRIISKVLLMNYLNKY